MYLTNELWRSSSKDEYEKKLQIAQQKRKEFSRHQDYSDRIQEVHYMMSPSSEYIQNRFERAPDMTTHSDYKLKFGPNKDLQITEGTKVVEAHMHQGQNEKHVTLIYQGLGSFTFALKPSVQLAKASDWLVTQGLDGQEQQQFYTQLQFDGNRHDAYGSGTYENGEKFDVKLEFQRLDTNHWHGVFDSDEGLFEIQIESLRFDIANQTLSSAWNFDGKDY